MEDAKNGEHIKIKAKGLFDKLNLSNLPKHSKTDQLNHQLYFVADTSNKWGLNLLAIVVPIVSFIILFWAIDPNSGSAFILYLIGCLLFVLEIFIVLFLTRNYNLKGIALDIEKDLRPNIHYAIKKILPGEELCQLEIRHPKVSHQLPFAQTQILKKAAFDQAAPFAPGLEFFFRDDGTFVFIHPVPTPTAEKEA